jgi:UDP-N-acetyl-D-mannosaminuronate dehydrogenase
MSNLVIGLGQIGQGIQKVLECDGVDKDQKAPKDQYYMLHICIPPVENFVEIVNNYKKQYQPDVVVVHSTVPIGTCSELDAVHSPVRGVHPNLEGGIRTFVKIFGGEKHKATIAMKEFEKKGVSCSYAGKSENTEAGKLWSTTQYGAAIMLEKEIHAFCEKHDLDFDVVYTQFNQTYNDGYRALGLPQFQKYVLKHMPGPIGGHCVASNIDLFDSPVCKQIKDANNLLKSE